MTEMQANKFVQRWGRTIFPERWLAKTEIQVLKQLEQLFLAVAGGTMAVMATSLDNFVVESIAAVFLFSSLLLYIRSCQACRVLKYAPVHKSQVIN